MSTKQGPSRVARETQDGRIMQLYVDEGKSIDDVRDTVNREFILTLPKRHYLYRIKKLNIERNVKAKERQIIVRYINHLGYTARTHGGRIQVRIRGHIVPEFKLHRWELEDSINQPSLPPGPLSPLPNHISISLPESSKLTYSEGQYKYRTLDSQKAKAVFNDLRLKLPARITYQPCIPNDSEVFRIVESGQVGALRRAIENGSASFGDRDEQGRPLLYYAAFSPRVEMCQFLIKNGADVNELVEADGSVRPVYSLIVSFGISSEDNRHRQMSHCLKIMLEAGADLSLRVKTPFSCKTVFYFGLLCWPLECLKHMINLGLHSTCLKELYELINDQKRYPLHLLAENCGYSVFAESVDIVEKAILLLKHGVNISCSDYDGSTILHTILSCVRYHVGRSKSQAREFDKIRQWTSSLHEPQEFLIVAITAGANVYATDNEGQTPSMCARLFGRKKEWFEALRSCGYDPEEIVAHSDPNTHDCSCKRPVSKLSLEEYCLRRKRVLKVRKSDMADDDKEVISDEEVIDDEEMIDEGESDEHKSAKKCQKCGMSFGDIGISDHYRHLLMEIGNDKKRVEPDHSEDNGYQEVDILFGNCLEYPLPPNAIEVTDQFSIWE